jgi:glycosyltransferase involved in cell wall biosynthesis
MTKIGVLFMQSQEWFGADSQIHASIMRHLPRDRFDVHCAVSKQHGTETSDARRGVERIPDVKLRPTEFGPTFNANDGSRPAVETIRRSVPTIVSLLGLAWYIRRNRIRIVHCTEKPRDAINGTVVAFLGGARCVIHLHVKAENWIRWLVRRSMHHAAGLIGVTEFVAQSIRDQGYAPSRVFAVLNGLECDDWVDQSTDGPAVRREFGIAPETPLIASVSRLYRYKGQHELLKALPAVKEHYPDVMVLVVGEDDPRAFQEAGSYTDELKALCRELSLEDNVVFTGFRRDVRAIMSACDIYSMPSFEEPFGMVFTEAMALERPVVALDNGGTKEVVVNGVTGLLSDRDDTGTLATNLLRLLDDPALRAEMGRKGKQRVVEFLNSKRMADEVAAVYETITR